MKPKLQALVNLLSDGEWHSGESLGEALGVSRAAVWKQLQQVEEFGVEVEKSKGLGYRLSRAIHFLSPESIASLLEPQIASQIRLSVEPSLDSTNQQLLDGYAKGEESCGRVLFTEYQRCGRGRRGRVWRSPYAASLCFSIAWTFTQGVVVTEGLSLAIGVAIVRALKALFIESVTLKWPNDLLVGDRKLGGILLEMSGDASGDCCVVVGVGLNVNMPTTIDIDQPWIDLSEIVGGPLDRNVVAASLLREMVAVLKSYHSDSFTLYRSDWERYNAYSGKEVSVVSGKDSVTGRCLGVAENGGLILDVGGEQRVFLGGELSLRSV